MRNISSWWIRRQTSCEYTHLYISEGLIAVQTFSGQKRGQCWAEVRPIILCFWVAVSLSSLSSPVYFRTVRWSWMTRRVTGATLWTATCSATHATWSTSSLAAPLPSLRPSPTNAAAAACEGRHPVDLRRNCQRVARTDWIYNSCCRGLMDFSACGLMSISIGMSMKSPLCKTWKGYGPVMKYSDTPKPYFEYCAEVLPYDCFYIIIYWIGFVNIL